MVLIPKICKMVEYRFIYKKESYINLIDFSTILKSKQDDWMKFYENRGTLDPWNTIHKIIKSNKPPIRSIHVTKDDGSITTSTREAGEVVFQQWFGKDAAHSDTKYHIKLISIATDVLTMEDNDEITFTEEELSEALNSKCPVKAPCPLKHHHYLMHV